MGLPRMPGCRKAMLAVDGESELNNAADPQPFTDHYPAVWINECLRHKWPGAQQAQAIERNRKTKRHQYEFNSAFDDKTSPAASIQLHEHFPYRFAC